MTTSSRHFNLASSNHLTELVHLYRQGKKGKVTFIGKLSPKTANRGNPITESHYSQPWNYNKTSLKRLLKFKFQWSFQVPALGGVPVNFPGSSNANFTSKQVFDLSPFLPTMTVHHGEDNPCDRWNNRKDTLLHSFRYCSAGYLVEKSRETFFKTKEKPAVFSASAGILSQQISFLEATDLPFEKSWGQQSSKIFQRQ